MTEFLIGMANFKKESAHYTWGKVSNRKVRGLFQCLWLFQGLLSQLRPRAKPPLFTATYRRGLWVNTMENDPLVSFMC